MESRWRCRKSLSLGVFGGNLKLAICATIRVRFNGTRSQPRRCPRKLENRGRKAFGAWPVTPRLLQ